MRRTPKAPTAITHTSIFSHKRRERRTCHYSRHGEQPSPKRREQPRGKHREELHQQEQNHIRRKREQTTHFTQRNTHPIERYQGEGMCPHKREKITGGISVKGRRGVATFYAFIQVLIFIPRNVPIHPFGQPSGHPGERLCPFSETGASPQGKGWRFSGKRWESRYTNREKAGYRSGNGYIPVQSERRLREYAFSSFT